MKILGIYHRKDNDGLASAAVLKHWASQNSHELLLVGYDYSDSPEILYHHVKASLPNQVFMVDVTFGGKKAQEAMIDFAGHCKAYKATMTVIDHHEKAFKNFCYFTFSNDIDFIKKANDIWQTNDKSLTYIFDGSISACELAYRHFQGTFKKSLTIETIGKYDTFRIPQDSNEWLKKCYPFQLGSRLMDSEKLIEVIYNVLMTGEHQEIQEIIEQGSILMAYEAQQYKRFEQIGFRIVSGEAFYQPNLKVGIINAMLDPSMFKPSGDYDVVCVYYQVDNATWKYSLRPGSSSNQLDYTELAAVYGGGGHAQACGFTHHYNLFENPKVIL